jgi:acetoin:2,6-dichlorophenolindophenol oxidoreductase subunit alpha
MADKWALYRLMLYSRLCEEAVKKLWEEGRISGEMHLGMGEEAIAAGVVAQLQDGDAMALDHRGTPPMLMRGVDPVLLLRELLGHTDGLCGGMGGHMHLFAPAHLAASSGIVGAAGPAATGFGLAAQHLQSGGVAVAFFGEGAMNQGMLLESLNLAAVWRLPVLFVCKDDAWAITTRSSTVVASSPIERARGLGVPGLEVDGTDVEAVWRAAHELLARARAAEGPALLHAHCVHLEGHFLGDPLLQIVRQPLRQFGQMAGPLFKSAFSREGTPLRERAARMTEILGLIRGSYQERAAREGDPVARTRQSLEADPARLEQLEAEVVQEVQNAVQSALEPG